MIRGINLPGNNVVPGITPKSYNNATSQELEKVSNKFLTVSDLIPPVIIGHRAGGYVYPENTKSAVKNIMSDGLNFVEIDVFKLKGADSCAVTHDDTVDRVTNGTGNISDFTTQGWKSLVIDNTNWFNAYYPDESPMTLDEYFGLVDGRIVTMVEIKDAYSKDIVADMIEANGMVENCIVTSFFLDRLAPSTAKGIETSFIGSDYTPQELIDAGVKHVSLGKDTADAVVQSYIDSGLNVLIYTLHNTEEIEKYKAMGVWAISTEDPIFFSNPESVVSDTDPFSNNTYFHGCDWYATRPKFLNGRYGWPDTLDPRSFGLLGWAGNVQSNKKISFTITYDALSDSVNYWGSVFFSSESDKVYTDLTEDLANGYHCLFRVKGEMSLYKVVDGVGSNIGVLGTTAVNEGDSMDIEIEFDGDDIVVTRTDVDPAKVLRVTDNTFRGGYLNIGRLGISVTFSDMSIS